MIRVYVCTGRYILHDMTDDMLKALTILMPRWTISREIVPFHICEQMKPESESVIMQLCTLYYLYLYLSVLLEQVMGLHANGGGLDKTA